MKHENDNNLLCLLIGKGFALDVYIPALISIGVKRIFIDKSLSEHKRTHLNKYNEYIIFVDIEDQKYKFFDYIILAVSPEKQYNYILNRKIIRNTNLLILEKPISSEPKLAIYISQILEDLKIKYLINYSFRYAFWNKELLKNIYTLTNTQEVFLIWNFKARHFINNKMTWKRFHSKGGGAIRLYGIHFIAMLADFGYSSVESCNICFDYPNNLSFFSCSLKSTTELPRCIVSINTNSSKNEFSCYYKKNNNKIKLLDLNAPFPHIDRESNDDPRIAITKKLLEEGNFNFNNSNVLKLWERIEDKITAKET
mgnify:CR=1 FL=1|tara:strand:+ start:3886 stop:4818 length:933 start_codon:yes stop_codon:yes gene_type:complete